ncbi:hypothetical protein D3C72_1527270 [compost metagenome]
MPHVGIERLGARHAQHDRTQHNKRSSRIRQQEVNRIERVDGPQDGGGLRYFEQAEQRQGSEPDQHDGAKPTANPGRSIVLDTKQHDQHHQHDREDKGGQVRGHYL